MTNEVVSPAGTAASGDQPTANPPVHIEEDIHDDNNDDFDALPHDEEASYCSTTSEESLAHSDADFDNEDDEANDEAGDTIASPSRTPSTRRRTVRTPSFSYDDLARRPRSNPRTRTPLRNPSPLLQGLRREEHVNVNTARIDNNVAGRQPAQMRPAPQDAGNAASEGVSSSQAQPQQQPQQQRVTIRLHAGLPVGSLPSPSTTAGTARASLSQTTTRRHAQQAAATARSTKQRPSRRKLRRWTNDSMRSIAADLARGNTRGSLAAADVYVRGVSDGELRREYEMPNAPQSWRSSFDTLSRLADRWDLEEEEEEEEDNDHLEKGEEDQNEHLRNDDPAVESNVSTDVRGGRYHKDDGARSRQKKREMERKKKQKKRAELLAARDRFLRGETAAAAVLVNNPAGSSSSTTNNGKEGSRFSSGATMFRHLDPRIRSIVTRAVASSALSTESISSSSSLPTTTTTTPSTYAARLLHAMEDILVHRKMASDESRKLVEEILARPLVVDTSSGDDADGNGNGGKYGNDAKDNNSKGKSKKNKKDKKMKTKNKSRNNNNKVGSMACRFHFETATTKNAVAGTNNSSGGGGKNAGFHRLLLHAVCQFHGMNASSSTCSYMDENLGDGRRQKTVTERVLTVTGTCRGREHRIVDEACRYILAEES